MKQTRHRLLAFTLIAVMLLGTAPLASASSNYTLDDSESSLDCFLGDAITFKVPSYVSDVEWDYSPSNCCSFSENGSRLTAVARKEDVCDVSVFGVDLNNRTYYHSWRVNIFDAVVSFSENSYYIDAGETVMAEIYDYSPRGTGVKPEFSSSNPSVATVDSSTGLVTGRRAGETTITVTFGNDSDTCVVRVDGGSSLLGLSPASVSLSAGEGCQLSVSSAFSRRDCAWTSSNRSVATVDFDGYVTAKDVGSATISCYYNGVTETCSVRVTDSGYTLDRIDVNLSSSQYYTFGTADFNAVCRRETSSDFEYIRFTSLPSSSKGTLYYRYGRSGESKVSTSDYFYSTGSKLISEVTFVPEFGTAGTVDIPYTGESMLDSIPLTGVVRFTLPGSSSLERIDYSTTTNGQLKFSRADFDSVCKKKIGYGIDYIRFTSLPSSSKGALYYRYGESGHQYLVSTTDTFNASGGSLIDDLSFVPATNTNGTVEISYTGESVLDETMVSGTIRIEVEAPKNASAITYSTQGTLPARFVTADFEKACASRNAGAFSTVRFTLPSTMVGKLYYNYLNPNNKGTELDSRTEFGASTTYLLSNVAFVPAGGYYGPANIEYTGIDKSGASYTGTVTVNVTSTLSNVSKFTDVASTAYYVEPVSWAIDKNVTNGTSATTFSPEATCTTAQILTFLWRAMGSPAPTTANPFTDVPSTQYYANAAIWAYEKGMLRSTTLNPDSPCLRSEVVRYLWILDGRPAASTSQFNDVPPSADYAQAVAWAVSKGVTTGQSATAFAPKATCKRGEIVTFLWRAIAHN